ncbi:MAG: hypothetical protein Fur0032_17090 [Terrimicrobiaceae bacterium]
MNSIKGLGVILGGALVFTLAFSPQAAAQLTRQQSAIESYRRQDWTGKGTYHRLGLIREQDRAIDSLQQEEETLQEDFRPAEEEVSATGVTSSVRATEGKKAVLVEEPGQEGFLSVLGEYVSLQGRANSMFFGSTNILNTQSDPIQAGQFAQFVGASIDLEWKELKLATSYDYAWFRFYDPGLSDGDFNTSTIRQALSYEKLFFDNKMSYTIQPNWQYTSLLNRSSGDQFFQQWTYGLGNEFAFFPTPWLIPTFSYNFSYLDADVPLAVADKFKHDFNLGVTFIPFKDFRLFISPSVQFSVESNVGIQRMDTSWTPTLAVTVQPLDWLAADFVGSYTDSDSTFDGASFTAITGTILVRAFFRW